MQCVPYVKFLLFLVSKLFTSQICDLSIVDSEHMVNICCKVTIKSLSEQIWAGWFAHKGGGRSKLCWSSQITAQYVTNLNQSTLYLIFFFPFLECAFFLG